MIFGNICCIINIIFSWMHSWLLSKNPTQGLKLVGPIVPTNSTQKEYARWYAIMKSRILRTFMGYYAQNIAFSATRKTWQQPSMNTTSNLWSPCIMIPGFYLHLIINCRSICNLWGKCFETMPPINHCGHGRLQQSNHRKNCRNILKYML